MFRPITETQKDVKECLLGELKPIRENLKELPAVFPPTTSSNHSTFRRR